MLILWPIKVPYKEKHWKLNTHVCLVIDHTILSLPIPFNTPLPPKIPYSNQATQKNTCKIFVPKKIPGIENFKPKKILRSSLSLEIPSTPLGKFHLPALKSEFQPY